VKLTYPLAATLLLLAALSLGIYGMGRSLWLDEAWVANSIQAWSLAGVFYYPDWLQTNPPLFLLLARAAVRMLGASNAAFRVVPLTMAVAAAAVMLAVSRRLLRPSLSLLATAVVIFNSTAIEYSRTLKPYSGELAASAALLFVAVNYLQAPDRKRFGWLLAAVGVTMPLGYPAVFLIPGIVLAVGGIGPRAYAMRRAMWVAALAGGMLLAMYWLTIRQNLAPELRDFWAVEADHGMTAGLWAALAFCVSAAIRAGFKRDLPMIVCLSPCLFLAVNGALGLYPVSHRTRLFALPCFVLAAAMTAENLVSRLNRTVTDVTALALAAGIAGHAALVQGIEPRGSAEENFAAAVRFLEQRVGPGDLLLVHACCKEGFLLYSALDRWNPPRVLYGDTGWPCCARGKDARPGVSTERAVIDDLDARIPRGYTGRIWLLFTTRPTHWSYVGLDEGELWRKHLWERGCPPGPYLRFENLAVSPMDCVNAR
jgi:hypothetical protein